MDILLCVLLVVGSIMSVLWGLRFSMKPDHRRWEIFNNFTVNFVGSFAGWCCVYAVVARAQSEPSLRALNGGDALLFLLSILGVIGMLPQAILGVVSSLGALTAAITAAISKKLGGD
jgi:hypothetical protein